VNWSSASSLVSPFRSVKPLPRLLNMASQAQLICMTSGSERPAIWVVKLKARLLVQFLREALVNQGWKEQRAGVVEYVVQELIDNAYVHGGAAVRGGTVRITATLNNQWAQCGVMDSGKGFSLDDALAAQKDDRLHGLSQVNVLARLTQRGPAFIEVVVESRAPAIAVREVDGIHVAQIQGRLDQGAMDYRRELEQLTAQLPKGAKVIVDLTAADYMSSVAMRLLFQLERANKDAGRTCVVVASPNSVMGEILRAMRADTVLRCAGTVEEARAMLG